ncbi:TRAP transporter substrate-binding protein DctP [Thermodesulfobacteriota bacterium]
MKTIKVIMLFLFVGVVLAFATTGMCADQKVIKLKYGGFFAPTHPFSKADQAYFKHLKELTNGRLEIVPYWSCSLISRRENVEDIAKGVVDMGHMSPSYSKSGFVINRRYYGWFYGIADGNKRIDIFKKMCKKYPEVEEQYSSVVPIQISQGATYQLLSAKKQINTVADMVGQQYKGTGLFVKVLTAVGAVGMQLPMGETYIAMQKGILDGCLAPYETLKSFRFAEVIDYLVELNFNGAPYYQKAMNPNAFKKLPPDIQKVIIDNIDWYSQTHKKISDASHQAGIDLGKKNGVHFSTMPKAEIQKLYKVFEDEARKSAKVLDERGYRGTEMFEWVRTFAD